MNAIYKMTLDYGRMGSLSGIFTADKNKMQALIESGKEVYFGEVLGKHSEVFTAIKPQFIRLVSDDPEHVAMFDSLNMKTGHNPFDYIGE